MQRIYNDSVFDNVSIRDASWLRNCKPYDIGGRRKEEGGRRKEEGRRINEEGGRRDSRRVSTFADECLYRIGTL